MFRQRSERYLSKSKKKLLVLGIGIVLIENDINAKDSVGILKLEIMAQMLENKKRLQSERIKEGLKKKRAKVVGAGNLCIIDETQNHCKD